jgi:CRP-like cAMP-binding protein/Fe-S-cluster-containing hydrogenase component 2
MSLEPAGKLVGGEPMTNDELIRYLPALAEVARMQLDKFGKDAAVLRHYRKGDVICREGEFGSTAFYIVSGRTSIYLTNPVAHVKSQGIFGRTFIGRMMARMNSFLSTEDMFTADPSRRRLIPIDDALDFEIGSPIAELGPGELFGEAACRSFQPRSATVSALEDCVVIEMLRVILDMLMGTREVDNETKSTTKIKLPTFKGTSFKAEMDRKYRERALATQLRRLDIFEGLEEPVIQELCRRAQLITLPRGSVICRQGEPGEHFYVIRSGMVKVSTPMAGGEMVRTYLSRGDYFGEVALLTGGVRTANCTALDTTDLVQIKAPDFLELLRDFPEVSQRVKRVADQRMTPMESVLPTGLDVDEFLNQGLFEAQNLLLIDLQKCTRCDLCVTACADAHDGVSRLLRDGQRYDKYLVATACRSCRDPLCMTQCPVGSIRRRESLEIVIEDWCIGCGKCAELCPFGNISMHPTAAPHEKAAAPAAKSPGPAAATTVAPAIKMPPVTAAPAAVPAIKTPPATAAPAAMPAPEATAVPGGEGTSAVKAAPVAASAPATSTAKAVPAAAPAAGAKTAAAAPKPVVDAKKATTCDLCSELATPSCVYACPHDAAMRVDPKVFFSPKMPEVKPSSRWTRLRNRTTH